MASVWLIRRWVDPDAKFKWVADSRYRPEAAEIRFDMYQAEFTHEGDQCTFEVLLGRLELKDSALSAIAEIIHDLDPKIRNLAARKRPVFNSSWPGLSQVSPRTMPGSSVPRISSMTCITRLSGPARR
jgi:hypothetical protein